MATKLGSKSIFVYVLKITKRSQAVVTHTFNPSTWEAEASEVCECKASLVYGVRLCLKQNTTDNATLLINEGR